MTEPKALRRRRAAQRRPKLDGTQQHEETAPGWSEGIRALYDGVVQEPLPPDFLELLNELGKKNVN